MVLILLCARWYRKHDVLKEKPTGLAALLEPVIVMIEQDVIKDAVGPEYKRFSPYLLTAFFFCFLGYFNGCGRTRFFFLQGLAGAFCVRIPLAILFSRIEPVSLFRIGLSTPCSSLVQTVMCIVYFVILQKQLKQKGYK